jgi:glutamate formiminotransferase / 5-formyltetrahydrofolate cyclo-ligase
VLECVVNIAAGAGPALDALAAACGEALLDRHADTDHDRSVFTLAGPADGDAESAALALAAAAAAHLDLATRPEGVHPRLGVVDVVPFVALGQPPNTAVAAAHRAGAHLAEELAVPVFFYDDADPAGRSLPTVRRDAFADRAPDLGPPRPDPRLGATAVGARPPLVAVNCWLDRDDVGLAEAVARAVRARDGGLPGVRALGLRLASRGVAQVALNVADLAVTGVEEACETVRRAVGARGATVERVEWVGLVPEAEWARCSAAFLAWSGLDRSRTVEARLTGAAGR